MFQGGGKEGVNVSLRMNQDDPERNEVERRVVGGWDFL
jgi:hypothetical protein